MGGRNEKVLYRHRWSSQGYRSGMDSRYGRAIVGIRRLNQRPLRAVGNIYRGGNVENVRRKDAYRLELSAGMIMGFRAPRMGVDDFAGKTFVSMEKEIR